MFAVELSIPDERGLADGAATMRDRLDFATEAAAAAFAGMRSSC